MNKPKIVVCIMGGVCQAVIADAPAEVSIFDMDDLEADGVNSEERSARWTELCKQHKLVVY